MRLHRGRGCSVHWNVCLLALTAISVLVVGNPSVEAQVCIFVRFDSQDEGGLVLDAVRSTWGHAAVFLHDDSPGLKPFWTRLSEEGLPDYCPWLLLVPSAWLYLNLPALRMVLQHLGRGGEPGDRCTLASTLSIKFTPAVRFSEKEAARQSAHLISSYLLAACIDGDTNKGNGTNWSVAACFEGVASKSVTNLAQVPDGSGLVLSRGFFSVTEHVPDKCFLIAFGVKGWVHQGAIHDAVRSWGERMLPSCRSAGPWRSSARGL